MASKKFKIVSSKHKTKIEDDVNVLLSQGYALNGSLSVCMAISLKNNMHIVYSQALIKH